MTGSVDLPVTKIIKIKWKSHAVLKHAVICMTHLIGILISFTCY